MKHITLTKYGKVLGKGGMEDNEHIFLAPLLEKMNEISEGATLIISNEEITLKDCPDNAKKGFNNENRNAYESGYAEGRWAGYNEGLDDGYANCKEDCDTNLNEAFDKGFEAGYDECEEDYSSVYDSGYNNGYTDGYNDCVDDYADDENCTEEECELPFSLEEMINESNPFHKVLEAIIKNMIE